MISFMITTGSLNSQDIISFMITTGSLNSQVMISFMITTGFLNSQDMISQINIYVMDIAWILCDIYV